MRQLIQRQVGTQQCIMIRPPGELAYHNLEVTNLNLLMMTPTEIMQSCESHFSASTEMHLEKLQFGEDGKTFVIGRKLLKQHERNESILASAGYDEDEAKRRDEDFYIFQKNYWTIPVCEIFGDVYKSGKWTQDKVRMNALRTIKVFVEINSCNSVNVEKIIMKNPFKTDDRSHWERKYIHVENKLVQAANKYQESLLKTSIKSATEEETLTKEHILQDEQRLFHVDPSNPLTYPQSIYKPGLKIFHPTLSNPKIAKARPIAIEGQVPTYVPEDANTKTKIVNSTIYEYCVSSFVLLALLVPVVVVVVIDGQ